MICAPSKLCKNVERTSSRLKFGGNGKPISPCSPCGFSNFCFGVCGNGAGLGDLLTAANLGDGNLSGFANLNQHENIKF